LQAAGQPARPALVATNSTSLFSALPGPLGRLLLGVLVQQAANPSGHLDASLFQPLYIGNFGERDVRFPSGLESRNEPSGHPI